MCDQTGQSQKTDTHYRSLDGDGNFNWRFVFDFNYLPAEQCIVYTKREKFGLFSNERKMKPILKLQCYDADQITSDDHLGSLELNLVKLIKGASNPEACSIKMLKLNSKSPVVNLFKIKFHKGWYPFKGDTSEHKDKLTVS